MLYVYRFKELLVLFKEEKESTKINVLRKCKILIDID